VKASIPIVSLLLCLASVRGFAADPPGPSSRQEELEGFLRATLESKGADPAVLDGIDPLRADEKTRKVIRALRTTRVGFDLEKQPLESVIELFGKVAGISFVLSAKAAESAKADKVRVSFAIQGLPLENVLNLLMLQLRDYRFVIRYGAIVVIRSEEYRPAQVLKVYDVSDLVRPHPDFEAPKLALEGRKN
jgi:hypothetical protein